METTQTPIKIIVSLAWGGESDDETLADVLADLRAAVPSSTVAILDAHPSHSGGWPLAEVTFSPEDLAAAEAYFDLEF
jgi:hypothetical protein